MIRIPVRDNTLGVVAYMWPVDAEEAARYDPTRHTIQSAQPVPKKNPGGRGH